MLALWVPELPFQLACQRNNALKDRPLAFLSPAGGSTPCLWLVNRIAKQEGIYVGEALDQALKHLPALQVLDPEPQTWWEAHSHLGDFLLRFSPQGLLGHCGEALLELKGTESLLGPSLDAAVKISKELQRDIGWVGHGGLSGSALTARLAAHLASSRTTSRQKHPVEQVKEGFEATFLAPYHLQHLSGLSPRLHGRLHRLGLRLLGDLQPMPLPVMSRLMPELDARKLLTQAKGEDRPRLPMLTDTPGHTQHGLRLEPPRLPEEVCLAQWCLERFWSEGRSPRRIGLAWWDVDGVKHQWTANQDDIIHPPLQLAPLIEKNFRQLARRRILIHRLELSMTWGLGNPKSLFESPTNAKLHQLEPALARLRKRYPATAILPGWALKQYASL